MDGGKKNKPHTGDCLRTKWG